MKHLLENLSGREKQTVIIGGTVVCLLLFYSFIWYPLMQSNDNLHKKIQQKRDDLRWMQKFYNEVQVLKSPYSSEKRSLSTLVNTTLKQESLRTSYVKQDKENRLRIRFKMVAFDKLLSWLNKIQINGVQINEAQIERTEKQGYVNATFKLEQ